MREDNLSSFPPILPSFPPILPSFPHGRHRVGLHSDRWVYLTLYCVDTLVYPILGRSSPNWVLSYSLLGRHGDRWVDTPVKPRTISSSSTTVDDSSLRHYSQPGILHLSCPIKNGCLSYWGSIVIKFPLINRVNYSSDLHSSTSYPIPTKYL